MALPPEIAGHLNLEGEPVTPRPSATVLLVRDGDPWELLLVHRPGGADFAPGAYVFPGGVVHADFAPGAYVFPGGTVHEDDRLFEDECRAAAMRELFEEAGILLAPGARDAECAEVRDRVEHGRSFGEALVELGLEPVFDSLVPFARWVTPAQLRRRFDARFYLARMPEGQTVRPEPDEVTDWLWVAPSRALSSPKITLVYATRVVLESVADTPDAATLFARAAELKEIQIVEPRIVRQAWARVVQVRTPDKAASAILKGNLDLGSGQARQDEEQAKPCLHRALGCRLGEVQRAAQTGDAWVARMQGYPVTQLLCCDQLAV